MKIKEILKKLHYKEGEGAVINAPAPFKEELKQAGFASALEKDSPFTILFVKDMSEFGKHAKAVMGKVGYDSLFWIAYPKGTSSIKTDINRDILWDIMKPFGYRPVSMVAIDKDWSAMRFRPIDAVKKK